MSPAYSRDANREGCAPLGAYPISSRANKYRGVVRVGVVRQVEAKLIGWPRGRKRAVRKDDGKETSSVVGDAKERTTRTPSSSPQERRRRRRREEERRGARAREGFV